MKNYKLEEDLLRKRRKSDRSQIHSSSTSTQTKYHGCLYWRIFLFHQVPSPLTTYNQRPSHQHPVFSIKTTFVSRQTGGQWNQTTEQMDSAEPLLFPFPIFPFLVHPRSNYFRFFEASAYFSGQLSKLSVGWYHQPCLLCVIWSANNPCLTLKNQATLERVRY